jgi:hypothetical protein
VQNRHPAPHDPCARALLLILALAGLCGPASASPAPEAAPREHAQPGGTDVVIANSAAINAAWKSWRAALDARAAFLDPRELAATAEQYRSWLVALNDSIPSMNGAAPGSPAWATALVAEGNAQREAALRRVLARIEPQAPALDDPAVEAEIQAARRTLAAWNARAQLLAADLLVIQDSLAQARPINEGGEVSIRGLSEKWTREGLTRQPAVRAAVAPVLDRVEALERVELETDAARLLQLIRAGSSAAPELPFAAWRRLTGRGEAVWPSGPAELAEEVAIRPILLRAAAGVSDPGRAAQLKDEVEAEQIRRLTRLLGAATDDATIAAADDAIKAFGLVESTLDGRIRYNLLLNRLKQAVSAPGITDARSRELARDFVAAVRGLQGGISFLSNASTVVAAIDAVAGGHSVSPATVEPGRFGPAAVGLGAGVEAGATIAFTLPTRSGVPETTLRFILVGEGERASYITVEEVTVGQVAAILAARDAERALTAILPTFRPLEDSRLGPRSWTWSRDAFDVPQIVPSPNWLSSVAVLGGIDFPSGQTPPPPTFQSPIQNIPATAAAYIASLAGCRLPTTGEWTSLLREHAAEDRLELANLRDSRWKAYNDHMTARKVAGQWSEPGDAGAFRAAGGAAQDSAASNPWDDGWLWFAPASSAANDVVSHVLGNVAEFTTTIPHALPTEPREVAAFMTRAIGDLRVVGGSALSDPAVDPRTPLELDPIDALEGFSDVGFRLAFGADAVNRPREHVGLQIAEILSPTPYLKPR